MKNNAKETRLPYDAPATTVVILASFGAILLGSAQQVSLEDMTDNGIILEDDFI